MKNKQQIVFVLGRGVSTVTSHQLCMMAKPIIDAYKSYDIETEIVWILPTVKTSKLKHIIENICGSVDRVVPTHNLFKERVYRTNTFKSWSDFYDIENWFDDLKDAKKIIILGGLLSSLLRRKTSHKLDIYFDRNTCMSFDSVGKYLSCYIQILKLANTNSIPITEISYDPEELSLDLIQNEKIKPKNHELLFYYDIPRYNMKKHNLCIDFGKNPIDHKERQKFCFGATFITKNRHQFYDELFPILVNIANEFSEDHISLFIKHNKKGINDSVDYDTYMYHLERSDFTLIIPSYDITTFSFPRFLEAINANCLPLIHEFVDVTEFIKSYGIDKSYIDRITVYEEDVIKKMKMTSREREEIIDYFKRKLNHHGHDAKRFDLNASGLCAIA